MKEKRAQFDEEAKTILRAEFAKCQYPKAAEIDKIAHAIKFSAAKVSVWFKNARAADRRRSKNEPSLGARELTMATDSVRANPVTADKANESVVCHTLPESPESGRLVIDESSEGSPNSTGDRELYKCSKF